MDHSLTDPIELLFSYGTLQMESVQMAAFGRRLEGSEDSLVGYKSKLLEIGDPSVIEASGLAHHPIIFCTGLATDVVRGTVFRVSLHEVLRADTYEVADYRRERLSLASGHRAWVYVGAAHAIN